MKEDLEAGKASLENFEASLEKMKTELAKGEAEAKRLKREQTDAQDKVDKLTYSLRLAKAKKVIADAEAHAAMAAREAEELNAVERTAERTKTQRQISAEVIANQQMREEALSPLWQPHHTLRGYVADTGEVDDCVLFIS